MARPGFVLEVDERTPPLVVPNGDTFRLERLPLGSEIVYPADSAAALPDLEEATAAALDAPLESAPLAERLASARTLTIVVDDNTVPVPPMRDPDVRAVVIETVLSRAARAGVDDVTVIVGTGLNRRMTPAELQQMLGERVFRSFFADGLLRNHDAENPDQLSVFDGSQINARVAGSDLVVHVHVVTDPRHCRDDLAAVIGSVATISDGATVPHLPVFQIDVVLDNNTFPHSLDFLAKREWEWSIKEQLAWRGIRRGLSLAPNRARRRFINRSRATFSATGVFAGAPGAVGSASRELIGDQLRVAVEGQVDVAVLGVGQHTPYSVDSPVNPILAAWQGMAGLLGSHTGRPLVREGGAVIAFHPMPNDFSPLHHPSYVDFFADVLPGVSEPDQVRADIEPKFAADPWYAHLYRTSQAFHAVHPLHRWYELEAVRRHCGEVVWVGADRAVVERLGFRAASTLSDALEIVSFTVGRSPRIGYLHAPPQILVDVT